MQSHWAADASCSCQDPTQLQAHPWVVGGSLCHVSLRSEVWPARQSFLAMLSFPAPLISRAGKSCCTQFHAQQGIPAATLHQGHPSQFLLWDMLTIVSVGQLGCCRCITTWRRALPVQARIWDLPRATDIMGLASVRKLMHAGFDPREAGEQDI